MTITKSDILTWTDMQSVTKSIAKVFPDYKQWEERTRFTVRDNRYLDVIETDSYKDKLLPNTACMIHTKDYEDFNLVRRVVSIIGEYKIQSYKFGRSHITDDDVKRLGALKYGSEDAFGVFFETGNVVKKFYDEHESTLSDLAGQISGIPDSAGCRHYAQVLLSRLMFLYFMQSKRLLGDDIGYLKQKLKEMYGTGQNYYRDFLRVLFFKVLNTREDHRSVEGFEMIPFLNGGLFDIHHIERDNQDITIPNDIFGEVFDMFDKYIWHLDEQSYHAHNEINPDILGHIFEKHVNQKQMGAYYTKEDITDYITRNTVIPFILNKVIDGHTAEFDDIWRMLCKKPVRYIYPAAGHGISHDCISGSDPQELKKPLELPHEIAAGLDDASRRVEWNTSAPTQYALPTEIWREAVARYRRYMEVQNKMATGEASGVNDMVTLNLNIKRFARDAILHGGSDLVWSFWRAVNSVSVLDPTCGSGAFLFATLNVLEPLYTTCLERMRWFVDDSERTSQPHGHTDDFCAILEQVNKHPNQRYFILKSIMLHNLYGADIMEEAVDICKLRLFLKLIAHLEKRDQIEPLPDIDFNIRSGNTLVGFTSLDVVEKAMQILPSGQSRLVSDEDLTTLKRINESAEIASYTFDQFRSRQATQNEVPPEIKTDLRSQFDTLRDELDSHMAAEYGVDAKDSRAYNLWRDSHQPFHWFVEFHGIMKKGGFDVVVGNPPYVEYSKIREYTIKDYQTKRCGNLYAMMIERSYDYLCQDGRFGMIVQLSYSCTDRMEPIQNLCISQSDNLWLSHFDDRPAKLFDDLEHIRATIILSVKHTNGSGRVYSTIYNRWHTESRPHLFNTMIFDSLPTVAGVPRGTIPKLGPSPALAILKKITKHQPIGNSLLMKSRSRRSSGFDTIYYHNAPQYWVRAMNFAPYFWNERDGEHISMQVKTLGFPSEVDAQVAVAALNSSLFYWWFVLLSDCRHLNLREIKNFPIGLEQMSDRVKTQLVEATTRLMANFKQNSRRKETRYKATGRVVYDEFNQKPSKHIVDEIDSVLARHYDFTAEELDYITNYDIKYRMGL